MDCKITYSTRNCSYRFLDRTFLRSINASSTGKLKVYMCSFYLLAWARLNEHLRIGQDPAHVLPEAAAEVEDRVAGVRFLEEVEDALVARLGDDEEFEELEQANARIWKESPCLLSLLPISAWL